MNHFLSKIILCSCLYFFSSCGLINGEDTLDYKEMVKGCTNKNVIMMVCDGCGFNQFIAADYFNYGEKGQQPFYSFPVTIAMSTYSKSANVYSSQKAYSIPDWVRSKFTDSGASATALATGVKTNNNSIGVNSDKNPVKNVTEVAHETGRSAGVVTSMPISHATPAGFTVHQASRTNYTEIAQNMITNTHLDVILGAGHPLFDNNGVAVSAEVVLDSLGNSIGGTPFYDYIGGASLYEKLKAGTATNLDGSWAFIESLSDFEKYASFSSDSLPDRLIGIAPVLYSLQSSRGNGPMPSDTIVGEHPKNTTVPDLKTMSQIALNLLNKNENGFFLMIEGGAIDAAAHEKSIARTIEEMTDFTATVEEVIAWIENHGGFEENLLIITADHETGFLIGPNGYTDKTIDYDLINNGKGKVPGHSFHSSAHTNQLVPLFAKGECAESIEKTLQGIDFRHGSYTDNAVLGTLIHHILIESMPAE